MKTAELSAWSNDEFPSGILRLGYESEVDGLRDWALVWPPEAGTLWIVFLHGHGSFGDQLYTRVDIRDRWVPLFRGLGVGILSPNLRGNAWMCPAAARDLKELLDWTRQRYGARQFFFASGSMGGTSNLIYAALHPEDVAAVGALCPATDLADYWSWLAANPGGVKDEIREAIERAYGGTPDQAPARYAEHSPCRRAERLTMPVLVEHGDGDALIPIEQSRALASRMGGRPGFTYGEIPGGHHDSPLHSGTLDRWLIEQVRGEKR